MIDLEREQPVTLAEAPRLIPAINAAPGMETRRPLHPRTIYNWATRGKHGVVLETLPVGGVLITTREALLRFFDRLATERQRRLSDREPNPGRRVVRRQATRNHAVRGRLAAEHGI